MASPEQVTVVIALWVGVGPFGLHSLFAQRMVSYGSRVPKIQGAVKLLPKTTNQKPNQPLRRA